MSTETAGEWEKTLWCIHIIEYHKDVKMNSEKENIIDYSWKHNVE